MQSFVSQLEALHDAADGATTHLIHHVRSSRDNARKSIEASLVTALSETFKKINWPTPTPSLPSALRKSFQLDCRRLLDLQRHDLEQDGSLNTSQPLVLLPFKILVEPLAQRFRYHFSGNRTTNRIDKPEFFLRHVQDLISDYADFVQDALQPLLSDFAQHADMPKIPAYLDATSALITALLPLLHDKLAHSLDQIKQQPNLLSKLVTEVMLFDQQLAEIWDYAPISCAVPYRGLAQYILSTLSCFPQWLSIEKSFALSRYEAIIENRENAEIDFDSVDGRATKPTRAALDVKVLVETITERYRLLSSFQQKMQFLIEIQIAIFDRFHARLHDALEVYLVRTSAVGRTMQGVTQAAAQETTGVKGLDRLLRVIGSADYLEQAMRDWGDEILFLELWDELQSRTRADNPTSSGQLSIHDMVNKTSSAVLDNDAPLAELQGALFDETATSYRRLRVRTEETLIGAVTYDIRNALRPYGRLSRWGSMTSTGAAPTLTAELNAPLRLLDQYLSFLARALCISALKRISRPLCQAIQAFWYDSVIIGHTFIHAGTNQMASDIREMWRVLDKYLGRGYGEDCMPRLVGALTLLQLPVKSETAVATDNEPDTDGTTSGRQIGLWEAERRIFDSNTSARAVLEELGLEGISVFEGREVLKRRIELDS